MTDLTAFDAPLQLVPMGVLADGVVRLRYAGSNDVAEVTVTEAEHRLLRGLDPTFTKHVYRPQEKAQLVELASRDLVRFLTPDSGLAGFSWALSTPADLAIVRSPFDQDIFMCVGGGSSFDISGLSRQLLSLVSEGVTVAAAANALQDSILSRSDGRRVLEEARQVTGRPFYAQLCDASINLTAGVLRSGLGAALPEARV